MVKGWCDAHDCADPGWREPSNYVEATERDMSIESTPYFSRGPRQWQLHHELQQEGAEIGGRRERLVPRCWTPPLVVAPGSKHY